MEYLCVDQNERYVSDARRRHGQRFEVGDVTRLEVPTDQPFDFILLNSLLHHLDTPSTRRRIRQGNREVFSVSQPRGIYWGNITRSRLDDVGGLGSAPPAGPTAVVESLAHSSELALRVGTAGGRWATSSPRLLKLQRW